MKPSTLTLLIILLLSACDPYQQDSYEEYYVIESYLVAGQQLPHVRFSTTSPVEEEYDFTEVALSGADIEIRKLNADSSIIERYPYRQQNSGIYQPVNSATVEDEQLYELHITSESGDIITSTTYVPGNFQTVNELQDQYVYQSEEQIEITATTSSYITGRQSFYIFTVNTLNPDTSNLTPFYRDLVINEDNDIENYFINSSGIINQRNYELDNQGNITLTVPWLAIAFYGENDVVANAIDNNMYDFLRSQDVQAGGSTLSPSEIQNIRYNVNGGIGIFGSMSSDTNRVVISRSD